MHKRDQLPRPRLLVAVLDQRNETIPYPLGVDEQTDVLQCAAQLPEGNLLQSYHALVVGKDEYLCVQQVGVRCCRTSDLDVLCGG